MIVQVGFKIAFKSLDFMPSSSRSLYFCESFEIVVRMAMALPLVIRISGVLSAE